MTTTTKAMLTTTTMMMTKTAMRTMMKGGRRGQDGEGGLGGQPGMVHTNGQSPPSVKVPGDALKNQASQGADNCTHFGLSPFNYLQYFNLQVEAGQRGPLSKSSKKNFAPNVIFRVVSCLYILYDLTYSFLLKNSTHSLSYKV